MFLILKLIARKSALKGMAIAGMAIAFALVVMGAYRRGIKMEQIASQARAREVLLGDLKIKERLKNEIYSSGNPVDRLRERWSRTD